jgi:DNA-binding NarL/FixJ family response regulator
MRMPRPLRKPTDDERDRLNRMYEINERIAANIEQNKTLASERREIVSHLMGWGWSMYGIALETGITPNTVKRIVESSKDGQ